MWEREKMLVICIFSFSHNVFLKSIFSGSLKVGLFGKELNLYQINFFLHVCIGSLFTILWEKEKLLVMSNFFPFTQSRIFSHFLQNKNCRLQTLLIWNCLKFIIWKKAPPRWHIESHDLVVVSLIPAWGELSFQFIFASHLYWSMWGK